MHLRSAALAAILALTVGACGDDGGGGYTTADVCDADRGLYIDFFQNALACQPELELILGSFPDAAELSVACTENFQPYVDDGTVVISQDDAAWSACIAYINGLDCTNFGFDEPNPCDDIFEGQLLEGEDCETDAQCEGDSFCDDSGGTACGTCQPRVPNGGDCISDDECSSRFCGSASTCEDRGLLGDPCTENIECVGQLICDAVAGECIEEPNWAENDACDGQDIPSQCGFPTSDWYCHPQTNMCTTYLALGEVCGQGAGFCRIFDYETCENGGQNAGDVCIAPTIVNEGDACGFADGLKCADGLVCYDDGQTSTCVTPYIAGDQCTTAGDCPGNLLLNCSDDDVCVYADYTGTCPAPAQ